MTRLITFTTLTLLALAAHAQYPGGMSDADMQKMMQGATAMATCMGNIDQDAMDRLTAESEQQDKDIKALCAEGKRDEAQSKALAFAREKADDPAMQAMIECAKQGMMPQTQSAHTVEDLANRHVCDE